jgi:hypothetical protein
VTLELLTLREHAKYLRDWQDRIQVRLDETNAQIAKLEETEQEVCCETQVPNV